MRLGLALVGRSAGRWWRPAACRPRAPGGSSCSLSRRCSGRPWSWSSRKKLPGPKMSRVRRRRGGAPTSQSSTSSARGDLAVEAGRQADQALRVPGEVLAVDARLVVVAVEVGVGDEAAQVPVAGPVLGQQDEVVGLGVGLALAVGHRASGDVGLDADDGLDLALLAGLVEGDRAVERAVVGDGEASRSPARWPVRRGRRCGRGRRGG